MPQVSAELRSSLLAAVLHGASPVGPTASATARGVERTGHRGRARLSVRCHRFVGPQGNPSYDEGRSFGCGLPPTAAAAYRISLSPSSGPPLWPRQETHERTYRTPRTSLRCPLSGPAVPHDGRDRSAVRAAGAVLRAAVRRTAHHPAAPALQAHGRPGYGKPARCPYGSRAEDPLWCGLLGRSTTPEPTEPHYGCSSVSDGRGRVRRPRRRAALQAEAVRTSAAPRLPKNSGSEARRSSYMKYPGTPKDPRACPSSSL